VIHTKRKCKKCGRVIGLDAPGMICWTCYNKKNETVEVITDYKKTLFDEYDNEARQYFHRFVYSDHFSSGLDDNKAVKEINLAAKRATNKITTQSINTYDKLNNQTNKPEIKPTTNKKTTNSYNYVLVNNWVEKREIENLIKDFTNLSSFNRNEAVSKLLIIGEPAFKSVLKVSESYISINRRKACDFFGLFGDPRGVKRLIELLSDSDRYVRLRAAHALILIGDERAVDALEIALHDSEYKVRSHAAEALEKIRKEAPILKYLAKLANEEDLYTRKVYGDFEWLDVKNQDNKEEEKYPNDFEDNYKNEESIINHYLRYKHDLYDHIDDPRDYIDHQYESYTESGLLEHRLHSNEDLCSEEPQCIQESGFYDDYDEPYAMDYPIDSEIIYEHEKNESKRYTLEAYGDIDSEIGYEHEEDENERYTLEMNGYIDKYKQESILKETTEENYAENELYQENIYLEKMIETHMNQKLYQENIYLEKMIETHIFQKFCCDNCGRNLGPYESGLCDACRNINMDPVDKYEYAHSNGDLCSEEPPNIQESGFYDDSDGESFFGNYDDDPIDKPDENERYTLEDERYTLEAYGDIDELLHKEENSENIYFEKMIETHMKEKMIIDDYDESYAMEYLIDSEIDYEHSENELYQENIYLEKMIETHHFDKKEESNILRHDR